MKSFFENQNSKETTFCTRGNKLPKAQQTIFVRPPFIVEFNLVGTQLKISTLFNHLDSTSKTNRKDYREARVDTSKLFYKKFISNQGVQEISEFLALGHVLEAAKNSKFKPDLVIYGGDTCIKNENYFFIKELLKNHPTIHSTLSVDQDMTNPSYNYRFITSLGSSRLYSNQYDKMLYINSSNDLNVNKVESASQDFKIDLYKVFENWLKDDVDISQYYKNWLEKDVDNVNSDSKIKNEKVFIKSKISDHAPVFTDIRVETDAILPTIQLSQMSIPDTNYHKQENTIRIAHWNILNYGLALNSSKSKLNEIKIKAKMIANIVYNSGFDIVGLTEINNGKGESVQFILDELNKMDKSQSYQMIIQNVADTNIPEALLLSNQFGRAQQEQVAVIYNKKIAQINDAWSYISPIKNYAKD